jgi:hypothetical protein
MRRRGGLARFDEVSIDRHQWASAADLQGLFAHAPKNGSSSPGGRGVSSSQGKENPSQSSVQSLSDEWHYEHDGTRIGPVSFEYLCQLHDSRELKASALVWRPGMPEWTKAKDVIGERGHTTPGGPSGRLRNNPFAAAGLAAAMVSFALLAIKVPLFPLVGLIGLVLSVIAMFTFDAHKHKNKWMAYVALLVGLGVIGIVAKSL